MVENAAAAAAAASGNNHFVVRVICKWNIESSLVYAHVSYFYLNNFYIKRSIFCHFNVQPRRKVTSQRSTVGRRASRHCVRAARPTQQRQARRERLRPLQQLPFPTETCTTRHCPSHTALSQVSERWLEPETDRSVSVFYSFSRIKVDESRLSYQFLSWKLKRWLNKKQFKLIISKTFVNC